jgi:hypothetical protein
MLNKIDFAITKVTIILSIVIIIVVSSVIAYQEQRYYEERRASSISEADAISGVLAEYAEANFFVVDNILKRFYDRMLIAHLSNKNDNLDLAMSLDYFSKYDYFKNVIIVDKNGKVSGSMYEDSSINDLFQRGQSIKNSPYFRFHTSSIYNKFNIASIVPKGSTSEYPDILVSRRLNNVDGSLNSVIFAVIKGDYLNQFVNSINLGNKKYEIAIVLDNGNVLFKGKDIVHDIDVEDYIKDSLRQVHMLNNRTFITHKFIKGYLHVFALKHLRQLPMSVALISYEGGIIDNWLSDVENVVIFCLLAVVLSSIILYFAVIISRKLRSSQEFIKAALTVSSYKSKYMVNAVRKMKISLGGTQALCEILSTDYFGKLNNKQKERIIEITTSLDQVSHDLDEVLYISNYDGEGTLHLNEKNIDLDFVIGRTNHILAQKVSLNRINIDDSKIDKSIILYVDAFKFIHGLINLFVTIIYYTNNGKDLEIHTERSEEDLKIIILSTGIDLESEEMRQEMLAVEKADNVDDVLRADSGLALAHILFRLHNIKLDAFSDRIQHRAGFIVTIPVDRVVK